MIFRIISMIYQPYTAVQPVKYQHSCHSYPLGSTPSRMEPSNRNDRSWRLPIDFPDFEPSLVDFRVTNV